MNSENLAKNIKYYLDGMLELDFLSIDKIETSYDDVDTSVSLMVKSVSGKTQRFLIEVREV